METQGSVLTKRVVLVVDDDARNRALVRASLASQYDVLEAASGSECLSTLGRARVDLVLLDVMMPALNGFDTCRAIKALPKPDFLPVLLLTALNSQEDRNAGLAAGADDFIAKPVDRRELALRVKAFMRLREQDEQIRQQVESLREQDALIRRQIGELHELQSLKDDLFGLLVHDLRNPLSGVVGFLELLEMQLKGPTLASARQNAAYASEGAKKLRDLLEGVLEVQRLEESTLPVKREAGSVRELLRDAAKTLEGAARTRTVSLEVACPEDLAAAMDRTLVRRAIENLISNAIKFCPPESTVTVAAEPVADGLTISIADRGPGISDTIKVRLFKKFAAVEERGHGGGRRGFGLGLHLVKLVATAHGGDVFIRDNEGGGSVFGFSLLGTRV